MDKQKLLSVMADNIRIERLRRRYSQGELAELANITERYLNQIETKKVNPTIFVVVKICDALRIEVSKLFVDE